MVSGQNELYIEYSIKEQKTKAGASQRKKRKKKVPEAVIQICKCKTRKV